MDSVDELGATLAAARAGGRWWAGGLLYQVYVWSFADSDGDGLGDLGGLRQRLDYLRTLGVDAIWLSPIMPSPRTDWGYDVADYDVVDPALGGEAAFRGLMADAEAGGLRVLIDLVPNHTSDQHPWFQEALADPSSPRRAWYVFAEPRADGGPPNNWVDATGSSAWTLDPASGQYYLHNFLPTQPDLNWWNPEVRAAFEAILEEWLERGVGGFRIDVAHGLVKDALGRDDPPAPPGTHPWIAWAGKLKRYSANRPEVHEIYRRWHELVAKWEPARVLLGETWVLDPIELARYYGSAEAPELDLCLNVGFMASEPDASSLRRVIETTIAALPVGAIPLWTGSNHDVSRLATRWAHGDRERALALVALILLLPGAALLYAGDELGMRDGSVPPERVRDPMGQHADGGNVSRDPCRTPIRWQPGPGAGFTAPSVEPWLPFGDDPSVEEQLADPTSVLARTKAIIASRRAREDLVVGGIRFLDAPEGVLRFRRGTQTEVYVNLADGDRTVDVDGGRVLVGTRRRGSERVGARSSSPRARWLWSIWTSRPRRRRVHGKHHDRRCHEALCERCRGGR